MSIDVFLKKHYAIQLSVALSLIEEHDALSVCLRCDDPGLSQAFFSQLLTEKEGRGLEKIANSNDYYSITGDGTIKIDEVRQAIRFTNLSLSELTRKYLWIEQIERTNLQAENAMLKLLEEPPSKTVIVVSCRSFYALMPTIQSRLFRLDLPVLSGLVHPLPAGSLARWIVSRGFFLIREQMLSNEEHLCPLLDEIVQMPLEDVWEIYLQICEGAVPEICEAYPFEMPSLKTLYAWRVSWDCFWDAMRGQGKKEWLKRFEKMDREIRQQRSMFFSRWFNPILDWLQEMVYLCVRLDHSHSWEDIGSAQWIYQWAESGRSIDLAQAKTILYWISRVQHMKSLTVHPQLTFAVLRDRLESLTIRRTIHGSDKSHI